MKYVRIDGSDNGYALEATQWFRNTQDPQNSNHDAVMVVDIGWDYVPEPVDYENIPRGYMYGFDTRFGFIRMTEGLWLLGPDQYGRYIVLSNDKFLAEYQLAPEP